MDLLLISLIIHVPAISIWIGLSLWDTFVMVTPSIEHQEKARLIGKTALLTMVLLAIILVTGIYQTIENPFRTIESYNDLSNLRKQTDYGMALFVKHIFVIMTFGLSPIIRFYLAPRAGKVSASGGGAAVATDTKLLKLAVFANFALGMAALVATSRMTFELH